MAQNNPLPPLSLYIHLPWCVQKCPYCDFNSHTLTTELKERGYIKRLLQDLDQHLEQVQDRHLLSIFIGGGTPSLFSGESLQYLLEQVKKRISFDKDIEITLEANPGTVEQSRFLGYRQAGINRISLGIQSFQDDKLKRLGRIHNSDEAEKAFSTAKECGFDNINIDIMHGLPDQTTEEALSDLERACEFQPNHLSWYQLTLEPNTQFYQQPPILPNEEVLAIIESEGLILLKENGFNRYEVSAYCQADQKSKHNHNYWTFGDYLAIGAGAHGKITTEEGILRYRNIKHPDKYLNPNIPMQHEEVMIKKEDLPFEFMLNALRLTESISYDLFESRTGLKISSIDKQLSMAKKKKLLNNEDAISTTELGRRFLNDCVNVFLS
jgi:putative oxygen-independent coproporphyrinogen III oxidase